MKLTLLGVRGSTPAPGPRFVRYGGHTSAVAVTATGAADPELVLDAGTGVRDLSSLTSSAFHGVVALTHLHWDHLQGLPFARALDSPDAVVDLWVPGASGAGARALFGRAMSPPLFPIGPAGLQGEWRFRGVGDKPRRVGTLQVRSATVAHKGGTTVAYRVDDGGRSVAYVPDHAPADGVSRRTLELLAGVDLLLHDAQYLAGETAIARNYGHSTVPEAIALACQVSARRLVLIHHAPDRDDEALDALAAEVGAATGPVVGTAAALQVTVGRQGDVLEL